MDCLRIRIHGLCRRTEFNGQDGTIVGKQGSDRYQVHIDSFDVTVALKLSNLEFLEHRMEHRMDHGTIARMDFGSGGSASFLAKWCETISRNDPVHFRQAGGDVYQYLIAKAFFIVRNCLKPGQAGWAFRGACPEDCLPCCVWADGSKGQMLPLTHPLSPYDSWWPCIVLPSETQLVPFLCPALAWSNGRPWECHTSRLRYVEVGVPAPPTPTVFETSTVFIEEADGDSGDEDRTENSWVEL